MPSRCFVHVVGDAQGFRFMLSTARCSTLAVCEAWLVGRARTTMTTKAPAIVSIATVAMPPTTYIKALLDGGSRRGGSCGAEVGAGGGIGAASCACGLCEVRAGGLFEARIGGMSAVPPGTATVSA